MCESTLTAEERRRRLELDRRWRREGVRADAVEQLESTRCRLRAAGWAREDAIQRAWDETDAAFPPLPAPLPSVQDDDADSVPDATAAQTRAAADYAADVEWAYENLDVPDVTPEDAPGPGAWGLLRWARANPNRLYDQIVGKCLSGGNKAEAGRPGRGGPATGSLAGLLQPADAAGHSDAADATDPDPDSPSAPSSRT